MIDVALASLLLLVLSPLLLAIAISVALWDGHAPLFAHERVGQGGRRFRCLKFRSMRPNGDAAFAAHLQFNSAARAEWVRMHKVVRDPRVTPLGSILRRTSLDELPQLLNVLAGHMSLVGPRPITPEELGRYGNSVSAYLAVRPGITGLWQVSGRSDCSYEQRVQLDATYVRTWHLGLDLLILLKTVPVVLSQRGSV